MTSLAGRLLQLAESPNLLVACDYDGTLSPLVNNPADAKPNRDSAVAIRLLAQMAQTHVAIISGRALLDLASLAEFDPRVHLVGSHGSEFDADFNDRLTEKQTSLRRRLELELSKISDTHTGFSIEVKPASVAFPYRNAPQKQAEIALQSIKEGPARLAGVFTKTGKMVMELTVIATDKGTALETMRRRVGASAVLFIGDDTTDEDAFRTLSGPDVGIKVGDGESLAEFRVSDTDGVASALAHLTESRSDWIQGGSAVPIEQHTLLSDQRTSMLLTQDARVVWGCFPRLDSPALFAQLIGGPTAGYFSIRPKNSVSQPIQKYWKDSMVVETRWDSMVVTDFMDCSENRWRRRAGRTDLVRLLKGQGTAIVEFAPRRDFGRDITRMRVHEDHIEVIDTLDPIVLITPGVKWSLIEEGGSHTARAEIELSEDLHPLELRFGTGRITAGDLTVMERLRDTDLHWRNWIPQLKLPEIEPESVLRSALTLRALCYAPSGGIAAAATTSLPESLGGIRNWDYRYCWLRDAAMSAKSLTRLGSEREAVWFLEWMLNILDLVEHPERLQPLYTIRGTELQAEGEIAELRGYAGSRPVRVGNAASSQIQIDVFGPIVDLIYELVIRHAPLSSEHWRLTEAMVRAVQRRWTDPDNGIWEFRTARRHHVHSKVMCWLTVDRGIKIARDLARREPEGWYELRDSIRDDILENGWKSQLNAFTSAYDGNDPDASALLVGLSGMIDADDPRFIGTIDLVERYLKNGPTVYRYRYDDGLPGVEGGFHLCTSWLIDAMILVGRIEEARTLFNDLLSLAGPTGLLSEEYDPNTKMALGNYPQAYSHLGIIDNALNLDGSLSKD